MPPEPNTVAHAPPIFDILHKLYQKAYVETVKDGALSKTDPKYTCPGILSLAEHLQAQLENYSIDDSFDDFNKRIFNIFNASLAESINARNNTTVYTFFVEDLTNFFFFVGIWMIEELGIHIDLKLTSRRKALEEELSKRLDSSFEQAMQPSILPVNPKTIRDWYGLRLVFEDVTPNELLTYTSILISILVNPKDSNRIRFQHWIENSNGIYGGATIPKDLLLRILSYKFCINDEKNFVSQPTDTTYQSWHGTLMVVSSPSNSNLAGFMIELQSRNYEMHHNAEHGPAAHWRYEELRRPMTDGVFRIDHYTGGISFYSGPDKPDMDLNGLSTYAPVLFRHVSPHAVPRHSTV